jgi:vacuolar-type H+-ATPase subunit I/STV1
MRYHFFRTLLVLVSFLSFLTRRTFWCYLLGLALVVGIGYSISITATKPQEALGVTGVLGVVSMFLGVLLDSSNSNSEN